MRRHYLKIRTVKDSKKFNRYLQSKSKEELVYFCSSINEETNFNYLNKEITFEIPNEFLNEKNELIVDPKKFKTYFIDLVEKNYDIKIHDYTLVFHNPKKEQKNLHCHFLFNSYSEKLVLDKSKPTHLTKDTYFYLKSGKVMKDKKKYDESNPNHILIKKGEKFIDFEKAQEFIKNFDNLEKKVQFNIRRKLLKEYRLDKKQEFKIKKTNDFNEFTLKEKKLRTDFLKDTLVKDFNIKLKQYSYEEKYLTTLEAKAIGLKSQTKHNIRGERKPDFKGVNIIKKNKEVTEYNNYILKNILQKIEFEKIENSLLKEEKQVSQVNIPKESQTIKKDTFKEQIDVYQETKGFADLEDYIDNVFLGNKKDLYQKKEDLNDLDIYIDNEFLKTKELPIFDYKEQVKLKTNLKNAIFEEKIENIIEYNYYNKPFLIEKVVVKIKKLLIKSLEKIKEKFNISDSKLKELESESFRNEIEQEIIEKQLDIDFENSQEDDYDLSM